MAAALAGAIAVPDGIWFAGRTTLPLAFIGATVLFLPLFVFIPRLVPSAMRVDTDGVLDTFGKNEHVRKVFWTLFLALAGLVLARAGDPGNSPAGPQCHYRDGALTREKESGIPFQFFAGRSGLLSSRVGCHHHLLRKRPHTDGDPGAMD